MKAKLTITADGTPARTGQHQGQTYVGLEHGQRYWITVKNNTHRRILAVVTVDGINVTDGEPGSRNGAGMVIEAHDSCKVDGWRTSTTKAAAFRLTHAGQSYAANTGDSENVGIIGLAVFDERVGRQTGRIRCPVPTPATTRTGRIMPASYSPENIGALLGDVDKSSSGTEFGEEIDSHVTMTSFIREGPAEIQVVRYDDVHSLIAKGILSAANGPHGPHAFPGDMGPKFCVPPTIPFET